MASNRSGDPSDRALGMGGSITRRDFVQGAAGGAYTDVAIDQAYRAVNELIGTRPRV